MSIVYNTRRRKAMYGLRRNWTELPDDLTAHILSLLRPIDLFRAQRVCGLWRRTCNHGLTWTKIDLCKDLCEKADPPYNPCPKYFKKSGFSKVVRQIVDRSAGNLDINLKSRCSNYVVATAGLLRYIVQSSKGIRSLVLECVQRDGITEAGLRRVAPKLSMLEELDITIDARNMSQETLQVVGRSCPLLKSFKIHDPPIRRPWRFVKDNTVAHAVATTMQGLQHLTIASNAMDDEGLGEILDCCPRLESLEIINCFNVGFKTNQDLTRRCEAIKHFKRRNFVVQRA